LITIFLDWESWNKSHLPNCCIAEFEGNKWVGCAALTLLTRGIYTGVKEVSFYIAANFHGKGVD
jgi:hypothetical protein